MSLSGTSQIQLFEMYATIPKFYGPFSEGQS